jgi:TPR repeat protein
MVDLTIAANQGDSVAQCKYGLCLGNGDDVSIDWAAEADYFKLAADQDNADG